jgi:hypothetical protein
MILSSQYAVVERVPDKRRFVAEAVPIGQPVAVTGNGFAIAVNWNAVPGANDVVIDAATLRIAPFVAYEPLADWPVSNAGNNMVDVELRNALRVHSVTLAGVTVPADAHLAVAIDAGNGFGPPQYTAPAVEPSGVNPATFTGASFDNHNHILTLPDVAAKSLRISIVGKDFPKDTSPQALTVSTAKGIAATLPRDLSLVDEEGTTVWSFPGEMPPQTAAMTIDLRQPIEKVLKPKVKGGKPVTAAFTLKGSAGTPRVSVETARGAVVRNVPGIIKAELAGEAAPLAIPPPPLADEDPSRVNASVVVQYHGIRLLEQFTDSVPSQAGAVGGVVVGSEPVLRKLPPAALQGWTVAKIGIIGRAPEDCELVAQLVDISAGGAGNALTQPASATLKASNDLAMVWLDVPKHDAVTLPAGISVRTNHGRFLWVAGSDPLLRIAVFDPDPAGRLITIGGSDAVKVDAVKVSKTIGIASPSLTSAPPTLDSLLFASVDVADLALEYDR